jgi:hypothetical protein
VPPLESRRGGYGCFVWFGLLALAIITPLGWLHSDILKPGQIVMVRGKEAQKIVYVGATEADAEELEKLVKAGDNLGLEKLESSSSVLPIAPETKALIIEHVWLNALYRVRILEGKEIGKSAWTSREFLFLPTK